MNYWGNLQEGNQIGNSAHSQVEVMMVQEGGAVRGHGLIWNPAFIWKILALISIWKKKAYAFFQYTPLS
jgi:hypothetical protein